VRKVVIVLDSADKPDKSFRSVRRHLGQLGFGMPEGQREVASSPTRPELPAVVVLTLPWEDRKGGLETLLLDAMKEEWPEEWARVEQLTAPSAAGLNVEKKSKMEFACMMALVCKKDPSCAASAMWRDKGMRHLLSHPKFAPLVEFLRGLVEPA
jgi:hypothetical protein